MIPLMVHWCLLVLVLLLLCKEASTGSTRELFDRTQLPRLLDTDMIELYHLRSFPLLLIDTSVGTFSTQTTGLALRSTSTGETIVLQYKPVNYSNCFLPIIGEGEGNNVTLTWDKRAEVVYYNMIDSDFWQQSTFLARINGVVYKNYIRWIETYVSTNRQFSPQSICSSVNDLSCFTFAETWETFLADSYQAFASFSVRLNAILPPRAVELRFLSFHEPIEFQLSASASVVPTEYPSSRPSVNPTGRPTAHPTAAITATPTGFYGSNSSSSTGSESPTEEDQIAPTNGGETSADGRGDRHFSDGSEESPSFYVSDSGEQKSDRTLRSRRNLADNKGTISDRRLRHTESRGTVAAPLESVEDSELDRPPRGGGYFPPSDDPLAQLPGGVTGGNGVEEVSAGEVAEYYSKIMACMQEYQLGDFTNALKSCMSETVGFVHIDGDRYYRIKHRYPFIYVYDYLEYIPDPMYSAVHGADYTDMGIIFFICLTAFIGFVASMAKLQVAEFFCADGFWWSWNSNSSSNSSSGMDRSVSDDGETGHHQPQSRVSRVMNKVWGTMGWKVRSFSSSYSPLKGSDDDLAVMGLRERVKMHSFGKETTFEEEEGSELGRLRGNSSASSASSGGFIGVPRMNSVSFDASSPRYSQTLAAAAGARESQEVSVREAVSLEMVEITDKNSVV